MNEFDSQPPRPYDAAPHQDAIQDPTAIPPVNVATEEQDGFLNISPKHPVLDRIIGVIFALVLLLGVLIAAVVMYFLFGLSSLMWLAIYGGSLALACLILFVNSVWPGIEYRHTFWRLNEDGLEIRRGVLWRHQISIPLARVQHADVSQGPFQRQYGLGTLTVNTAGTQNASVSLDGLPHAQAIELRDRLVRQGKALNVV